MPPEAIELIAHSLFPDANLTSVVPLPSGKSYNNRIYFLKFDRKIKRQQATGRDIPQLQEFVLKVNGRFFGATKVQNEVGCLRLVEKYCPEVPAPQVFAWSEDGKTAVLRGSVQSGWHTVRLSVGARTPGWILLQKVPGEPVQLDGQDVQIMESIGVQLADLVAAMRQKIPQQHYCGNILLRDGSTKGKATDILLSSDPEEPSSGLTINGLLGDDILPGEHISSAPGLHKTRLQHKIDLVETEGIFAPNRHLVPRLQKFMTETLPVLKDTSGTNKGNFVFTHYDLSPRNTLVSGSPPRITGLIDFEFAGFFPPTEEFVNDSVGNSSDWPVPTYEAYLARLETLGVATPASGFDREVWLHAHELAVLEDNVAPWWLRGGYSGEELTLKLLECEKVVLRVLESLSKKRET